MSSFEIAVKKRHGMQDEPELSVESDVIIKEAWLYRPNYTPESALVMQERQYKCGLILPIGSHFRVVIDDEVRRVVRRVMRFLECREIVRRAA